MMSEDVVLLASGVSLPLILRRAQYGYHLVGPWFFKPVMSGEVWKDFVVNKTVEIVMIYHLVSSIAGWVPGKQSLPPTRN